MLPAGANGGLRQTPAHFAVLRLERQAADTDLLVHASDDRLLLGPLRLRGAVGCIIRPPSGTLDPPELLQSG